MREQLKKHDPQARCYACGRLEIVAACHHCGRGICSDHLEEGEAPKWFFIKQDEFQKLDLEPWAQDEIGIHCKYHLHYRVRLMRYLLLFCLLVALIVYPLSIAPFEFNRWSQAIVAQLLLLFTISVLLIGLPIQLWLQRQSKKHPLPSLPLIGRERSIAITEELEGDITLKSDGAYSAEAQLKDSYIETSLKLTQRDFARLEKYQKQHHRDPHSFHAGFVMLKGAAQIVPQQTAGRPSPQADTRYPFLRIPNNTLAIGNLIEQLPFLQTTHASPERRALKMRFGYKLRDPDKVKLPLEVIPFITQRGEHNVVELHVQLPANLSRKKYAGASVMIEEMRIMVPTRLALVTFCIPRATSSVEIFRRERFHVMRWSQIALRKTEDGMITHKFQILFENNTQEQLSGIDLRGFIQLRLNKLASGIEGVRSYYPLGHELRKEVQPRLTTRLHVRFLLDLSNLGFQRSVEESPDCRTADNVRADYELVNEFVTELSEKLYVKRVAENPVQHDASDAYYFTHYWDIIGRAYQDAYAAHCHIILMGETFEDILTRRSKARTRIEVTVRGIVTDVEIARFVKKTSREILTVFDHVIEKRRGRGDAPPFTR